MPNAPSESLEKNVSFIISCANSAPSESLEKYLFSFSFISGANSGSEHLLLGTSAMAEPLARFEGFEGFKGFEGFEGLHFPCQTLPLNP